MKLSVGAAYSSVAYAKNVGGVYVKAPSFDDIVETIRTTADMGYDAVELETLVKRQAVEVFTAANIKEITKLISEVGISVPHFNAYSVISELSGATAAEREEGVKSFRDLITITKGLGSGLIILSGSPIPGVRFSPGKVYSGGPPESVEIPREFDWVKVWRNYVEVIGQCADLAQDADLKLAIEPRPREIITNSDSMLRLINEVDRKNLGALLDTAHLFVQKEILPLAVQKLQGRIFGLHMADNDGLFEYHWTLGKGKIHWADVLRALKSTGFDGYLTVELEGKGVKNLVREYKESRKYLARRLKALK